MQNKYNFPFLFRCPNFSGGKIWRKNQRTILLTPFMFTQNYWSVIHRYHVQQTTRWNDKFCQADALDLTEKRVKTEGGGSPSSPPAPAPSPPSHSSPPPPPSPPSQRVELNGEPNEWTVEQVLLHNQTNPNYSLHLPSPQIQPKISCQ